MSLEARMSLDEYKRKRRFVETPEPPPEVETKAGNRFVVQKHDATRLHYDFRLEMEGVLKSWAVPKGPSLDPADKRLAMQVEDHPVSYFDFEGNIPDGNYGAGSVMVWDMGTWQPLSPVQKDGKYVPGTEAEAAAMLAKGDLKFRLHGQRLKGDFALVKMKGRRPGSKGNEWLMIKKHDDQVVEGYDAGDIDESVLSQRSLAEIAGDAGSREWKSRPAGRGKLKAAWLADAVARLDQKKKQKNTPDRAEETEKTGKAINSGKASNGRPEKPKPGRSAENPSAVVSPIARPQSERTQTRAPSTVNAAAGPVKRPMPATVHPMLAESIDEPFDSADWLFEIKWDGYRAVAFIENGKVRLRSRNQNDLTPRYPELKDLPQYLQAKNAILDGEVVALDEQGRASFSLMQQRTGFRPGGRRTTAKADIPVLYYAFDLLYLDGYDWRRVPLEQRKKKLASVLLAGDAVRYSDHYAEHGKTLFAMAQEKGLEGILAKKRESFYEERRSREWLKLKIRHGIECVVGGYTEPEGSRVHFGSLVLGLYDNDHLIHVGQVGSGFDQKLLDEIWGVLKKLQTKKNPFYGEVEALRKVSWVKPELVAEVEYADWTGGTSSGKLGDTGPKLRAPVFLRLRDDKDPKECRLEETVPGT
jgi:bifunctional non-homologous end joining protein LigD